MDGQQKRGQADEIIDQWVVFFLDCLLTLTQRLTEKRQQFLALKAYLNERQKRILDIVKKETAIQIADLVKLLPEISRATIKHDLSLLVSRRLLIQVGQGRGVRYFANSTSED